MLINGKEFPETFKWTEFFNIEVAFRCNVLERAVHELICVLSTRELFIAEYRI